ncbi:MAG: 5'-methylthioadenosine/S-adenosylhomocysteine nucleosidase [Clostridia bacterium]|nr:5'-methylthioadenosine/S-adenosylhomocysteine nucleosidase [Clostridia bacterium]
MRIGIITAMASEMKPIYKKLGTVVAESVIHGVRVSQIKLGEHTLYLATGGVGEICAAMTVQMLVDLFDVETVLNFGFVGTLRKDIKVSELVIADRVCHYQFDTSAIDGTKVGQYFENDDIYFYLDDSLITRVLAAIGKPMRRVAVASGDVFIASAEQKQRLTEEFDCDICEMELAALAIACKRNNIPLVSIKVVSDGADEGAPLSFDEIVKKGISKYEEILPAVIAAVTGEVKPLPPAKKQ